MSFFKTFTTAASAAVIATTLTADFADARDYRRGPSLGTALGIGAVAGALGALTQSRGAFANPYNAFNNSSNFRQCRQETQFVNGRVRTRQRCTTGRPDRGIAPQQPSFQGRQCVQGNYVVPCSSIPGRQFR